MGQEGLSQYLERVVPRWCGTGSATTSSLVRALGRASATDESAPLHYRRAALSIGVWNSLARLFEGVANRTVTRPFAGGVLADQQHVRFMLADSHFLIQTALNFSSILQRFDTAVGDSSQYLAQYTIRNAQKVLNACCQLGGATSVIEGSDAFELARTLPKSLRDLQALIEPGKPRLMDSDRISDVADPRHRVAIQQFINEDVRPFSDGWESTGFIPRNIFQAFARRGFFSLLEQGGSRQPDIMRSLCATEALTADNFPDLAVSLMLQANSIIPLLAAHGTSEMCASVLEGALEGNVLVSLAATEPSGGSDLVNAVQTTCAKHPEGFVLNGEKLYITNAPIADYAFILARIEGKSGSLAFNAFLVPTRHPGVEITPPLQKLGLHRSPTGGFRFHNCLVPAEALVGNERRAITYFTEALHNERVLIAASATALAISLLRQQEGKSIDPSAGRQSSASSWLEYSLGELLVFRSMVRDLARQSQDGKLDYISAAMAKATMPAKLQLLLDEILQVQARSEPRELPALLGHINDARIMSIFAGTSETMRELAGLRIRSLAHAGGAMFTRDLLRHV